MVPWQGMTEVTWDSLHFLINYLCDSLEEVKEGDPVKLPNRHGFPGVPGYGKRVIPALREVVKLTMIETAEPKGVG